jgi:hypothetical protein
MDVGGDGKAMIVAVQRNETGIFIRWSTYMCDSGAWGIYVYE